MTAQPMTSAPQTSTEQAPARPVVTVMTKPSCVQCNATYRKLESTGVPYEVVDMSQDPEALERMRALNFMQAPVVEVRYPDGRMEHFSGFQPDRIIALAAAFVD